MIFTVSFPSCTIAICPRDGKLLCYEFHYILQLLADVLAEVTMQLTLFCTGWGLNTNEIWRIPFVLISSGLGRRDVLHNFIVPDLRTNEQASLLAEASFNTKNDFFFEWYQLPFLSNTIRGFLFIVKTERDIKLSFFV